MSLTQEELFLFQHSGYHLIKNALEPQLGEQLIRTIKSHAELRIEPVVCEDPDRPGQQKRGNIPGARVLRLSKVLTRDDVFRQVATSHSLIHVLTALLGPNVEVVLNRHNHVTLRPPGAADLEWHRDVSNWSRPIVSAIFYLQDSTLENGCTWVIPGSHHMLSYHARLASGHGKHDDMSDISAQALPVLARALDVLLIHGLTLHSAGANQSTESRMSMTLGYHAADELGAEHEAEKLLVAGQRMLRHN